ncbi:MAG: M56 family metallopeptidase [Bacteroidales bacterium]|nr:M56 family metallopeptidase [Bacteroidales bacterium]MCM1416813.1 M56 family metallopeptidase [bacterium]MCM1422397.1 M56 family metallopeptidase [bacterium]
MNLLQMSVSGAVMIFVILVIRALAINRLPKRTFSALWGVTLVRLLVPYTLPSVFSVYSLSGRFFPPSETAPFENGISGIQTTVFPVADVGVMSSAPAAAADSPAASPYVLLWLIGTLVCTLYFAAAYLKCRLEFRESLPVDSDFAQDLLKNRRLCRKIRLRQSDRISAPLTYGVFRPVILLPKRTDWKDETALTYVLAHEYIHIRRFDAVTKFMLAAALCIHWFNPAVWIMYVLANRDLELSCDEAVIRLFGGHIKSAYARALIRMEETRSGLRPLCNNFSRHSIKERITAIMKMKKTTWFAALAALTLIIGVTAAFATTGQTAAAQAPDEDGISAHETTLESFSGMDTENAKLIAASKWFPAYETYGLCYDAQQAALSYDGQLVNFFHDETAPGVYTHVTFSRGTVGIKVLRNADWEITGLDTCAAPTNAAVAEEDSLAQTAVTDAAAASLAEDVPEPTQGELLAEYGNFGISFDASGKMLYQGKTVCWFADFVELEEGALATRYVYQNDEGTEYLHTVRDRIDNGDGSYDPFGPLTAIVPWEAAKRDDFCFLVPEQSGNETTEAIGNSDAGGETFAERFAKYKDFGITYVEAEGASGRGNVYLNGQAVSHFADVAPNGDAFSFTSAEPDGIRVHTDYDERGNLIGVQEMLPEAIIAEEKALQYAQEESLAASEQTIEQLAPYLALGLDYQYDLDNVYESSLTMTWQGKPVHSLFDAKRELFIANSLGDGGLGKDAVDLEAVYDSGGNLTGLKATADR